MCLDECYDAKDEQFVIVEQSGADFAAMQVAMDFLSGRCGRDNHLVSTCRATKTVSGKTINISAEE